MLVVCCGLRLVFIGAGCYCCLLLLCVVVVCLSVVADCCLLLWLRVVCCSFVVACRCSLFVGRWLLWFDVPCSFCVCCFVIVVCC